MKILKPFLAFAVSMLVALATAAAVVAVAPILLYPVSILAVLSVVGLTYSVVEE